MQENNNSIPEPINNDGKDNNTSLEQGTTATDNNQPDNFKLEFYNYDDYARHHDENKIEIYDKTQKEKSAYYRFSGIGISRNCLLCYSCC